jgi:hypothetical protein
VVFFCNIDCLMPGPLAGQEAPLKRAQGDGPNWRVVRVPRRRRISLFHNAQERRVNLVALAERNLEWSLWPEGQTDFLWHHSSVTFTSI